LNSLHVKSSADRWTPLRASYVEDSVVERGSIAPDFTTGDGIAVATPTLQFFLQATHLSLSSFTFSRTFISSPLRLRFFTVHGGLVHCSRPVRSETMTKQATDHKFLWILLPFLRGEIHPAFFPVCCKSGMNLIPEHILRAQVVNSLRHILYKLTGISQHHHKLSF
jgi:hypothetical protein